MPQDNVVTVSEEYSESIVNTVREPLIVLDQDLRVVTASRSFYDVFKVTPEDTVGQLIYDLGNKQWDIPKLRELLETILPEKATFDDYEVEHDFATIGRRTMLLNARRIPRPPKKLKVILLAIEDITKRKARNDSYHRLAAIVNTSVDGIIGKDMHGDIVSWNTAAETIYGYSETEIQGKNISLLAPPGYEEELRNQFIKLQNGEAIKNHETKRVRKDGVIIDISLTLSPLKDKSGGMYGVSAIMHDITEQKKAKQVLIQRVWGKERIILLAIEDITERRETEKGLDKAHEELNALASELKRTARVKSEFLANMSHELRTPLNSINGFSEVLYDETFGPLNEKQKKYVNNVLTSGKHLLLLINQILDMAKVEAGKMKLSLSSLPMKSLIYETRDIPIVFVTASVMAEGREAINAIPNSGFIGKPINTRTFAKEISRFIE